MSEIDGTKDSIIRKLNIPTEVPPHLGGHAGITHLDPGALRFATDIGCTSMIDIGCGPGGMVDLALDLGFRTLGIDGDPTFLDHPLIQNIDYTKRPYLPEHRSDLGWTCEFLEHVEERFLDNVFTTFSKCRYIFATAAPPGAGGHHHVNCKDTDYWIQQFESRGFAFEKELTDKLRAKSTMQRAFVRDTGMVFLNENIQATPLHFLLNVTRWPELGVAYFGITKSGNTSVKGHLHKLATGKDLQQLDIHQWHRNKERYTYRELQPDLENFTVFREPLARFASLYKHVKRYPSRTPVMHRHAGNPLKLAHYLASTPDLALNVHARSQSSFLPVQNPSTPIKVLRLEHPEDWDGFTIPYPETRRHVAPDQEPVDLWDETKAIIRKRYALDYNIYNSLP